MNNVIPQLDFSEISPELQATLGPYQERLNYFGEFFRYFSHTPEGLTKFIEFTFSVKNALPDNINEVIGLSICAALDSEYELVQHERMSRKLGFSLEWIAAASGRTESTGILSEQELAVRNLALAMTDSYGRRADNELAKLGTLFEPSEIAAILWQIGRFNMVSLLVNVLQMQLPVDSVFKNTQYGG